MEQRIKNLSKKICLEHFKITDAPECKNLHMLWYMYVEGSKKDTYKPFVFLAELRLLQYLGYMDKSSIENAVKLLESPDKENLFVASQVIQFFRKERIKDLGEFDSNHSKYIMARKDYESKILNQEVWSNKKKLEKND
jgi:hypothetical protein|tara:strand:- start:2644 stop:3057 length:414 start_codon:yes stop_codon:yes gene_type:complete